MQAERQTEGKKRSAVDKKLTSKKHRKDTTELKQRNISLKNDRDTDRNDDDDNKIYIKH